ncbi:MAG: hypothetical protein OEU09_09155 [Rhodospirillales bacterium]|nr:hypothetical protein [Rhodospirillales bacterium]MDH3790205.1 hypothetical protein [Rhodospirillales bacterium]MDH3911452.1 hypothetical protein [Rhodospirillales bacterium]MDH3917917.1 hypothetical protein [Rhodospirillales bacterium]MDH3969002.1 hypothetical protein [Rhodospirillales bacterium]
MKISLIIAAAGLVIGTAAMALGPSSAWAGQEKAEKEYKAELKECKKIAEPGQKDDCVRNAKSNYENRKQADGKSMIGTEKAKEGATKKAVAKDKKAAAGGEELKKKAGKAKKQ